MLFQNILTEQMNKEGKSPFRQQGTVYIFPWKVGRAKVLRNPTGPGRFFVSTENVVLPCGVKVKPDICHISTYKPISAVS